MMEKKISQNRLAKAAQISQSGISSIISGSSSPKENTLQAIAKALDCSVAELMGETVSNLIPINRAAIPIVGEIACGTPILAQQNIDGYADLPDGIRADFALRCKGDSMIPTFQEGDLVLIRQQPEVENGQIAAVAIDGEVTLKHVYRTADGLMLTAENPVFAPITVSADSGREISIYGLAVGYTRLF
ncbi:MAG: helix-turn-helix domain-containing protein [Clostridia bacterium]|nr:helix-turn-helix domain-containing protein [Clostridia bacterium]